MTFHSRKWKEAQAAELKELANKYPVIAVASLENFPGALAKDLRKKLQGKAVIKVSKTRIVLRALKDSKADLKGLEEHISGNIAVIFSELNPFELYAFLKRNSVSMPAKAGVVAPDDILVPAGDTGLPPGPALSDLKAAGLKTVMQGPTISIAEDKVVSKKGETISGAIAGALSKLGIKPVKVRLSVKACIEKGQVFLGEVLNIDVDKVRQDFTVGARNALSLAVETAYFTKETAELLVSKGFKNAKAIALEANILNSTTVGSVLAKANAQAVALKGKVKEAPAEEKKEEKAKTEEEKEESAKKPEEKKEEAKPEKKAQKEKKAAGENPAEGKKEEKADEKNKDGKAPEKTGQKKEEEKKA